MPTGAARLKVEKESMGRREGKQRGGRCQRGLLGGARIAALVLTLYWCLVLVQAAARSLSLSLVVVCLCHTMSRLPPNG